MLTTVIYFLTLDYKNKEAKMTHDEAENFLAHFGKKGMKWGQRMAVRNAAIKTARQKSDVVSTAADNAHAKANLLNKYSPNSLAARQANIAADKAATKWLNDKNFETASKMTSGEIAVTSILATAGAVAYYTLLKS